MGGGGGFEKGGDIIHFSPWGNFGFEFSTRCSSLAGRAFLESPKTGEKRAGEQVNITYEVSRHTRSPKVNRMIHDHKLPTFGKWSLPK